MKAIICTRFQFLYGSIKSSCTLHWLGCQTKFQFLYGSIKSPLSEASHSASVPFQFLYGSIKSSFRLLCLLYSFHFNSCMVRLKVLTFAFVVLWGIFQFLYGSIKRTAFCPCNPRASTFQFLYGSIKRITSGTLAILCFKISIPVWFD